MNDLQRENLRKLADYLAKGETQKVFDMAEFCTHQAKDEDGDEFMTIVDIDDYKCGTAACAIGHGPAAGISAIRHEGWEEYTRRAFGVSQFVHDDEFSWMFSSAWADVDNTPQGAAARIYWFLERGVPEDSDDQMNGYALLCYQASVPTPTPVGWDKV